MIPTEDADPGSPPERAGRPKVINLGQAPGRHRREEYHVGVLRFDERAARLADGHHRLAAAEQRTERPARPAAPVNTCVHQSQYSARNPLPQGQTRLAKGCEGFLVKPNIVRRAAQFPREPEPRFVIQRRHEAECDTWIPRSETLDKGLPAKRFRFVGRQVYRMFTFGERRNHRLEVAVIGVVSAEEQDSHTGREAISNSATPKSNWSSMSNESSRDITRPRVSAP